MAEIKTRPATPEFRDNWDRIFRRPSITPDSIAEVEWLMVDAGVGGKVVVRDVSGEELGCIVTNDADYNRKLCNALFKVSHMSRQLSPGELVKVDVPAEQLRYMTADEILRHRVDTHA